MLKLLFLLIGVIVCIEYVLGHGMVLNPASRSSRWRFNSSAPVNWDDNQLYCGGFGVLDFWFSYAFVQEICSQPFSYSRRHSGALTVENVVFVVMISEIQNHVPMNLVVVLVKE